MINNIKQVKIGDKLRCNESIENTTGDDIFTLGQYYKVERIVKNEILVTTNFGGDLQTYIDITTDDFSVCIKDERKRKLKFLENLK